MDKERIEILYQFLGDMTPEELSNGIKQFIMGHEEIFPNTNIIAHIRKYGGKERTFEEIAKERWAARPKAPEEVPVKVKQLEEPKWITPLKR